MVFVDINIASPIWANYVAEILSSQLVCIAQTALPAWVYVGIDPKGGAYEEPPLPRNTLFDLQQAGRFNRRFVCR